MLICTKLRETLSNWIKEGYSCHALVDLGGEYASWVDTSKKSQSNGPFYNNKAITFLVEVGLQEGAAERTLTDTQMKTVASRIAWFVSHSRLDTIFSPLMFIGDYWQARTRQAEIENKPVEAEAWVRAKIHQARLYGLLKIWLPEVSERKVFQPIKNLQAPSATASGK